MFFLPLSVNQHHYHFSHSQNLTLSLLNHAVYTVKDWGLHALHENLLWEKSSRDKFWGFSNPDNTCPMGGKVWSFKHKYISHFLQHSGINLREHLLLLLCYGLFLWANTIHFVMWITKMHEHLSFPGFLQENTWVISLIFAFYHFLSKVYRCQCVSYLHKPFLSCKKKIPTDSKHYLDVKN